MTNDAALEAQKKGQQITNAYHRVFQSEDGQLVLEHLRSYFRVDRPAFQRSMHNAYDPLAAAMRDGQREVILFIQHKLAEPAVGDADFDQPKTKIVR
jgi:hypothetical protein